MKRGPNKPQVQHIAITPAQDRMFRDRCRPILEAWGKETYPAMDVNKLVRSVYLLGVMDGIQVAERSFDRSFIEAETEKPGTASP